MNRPRWGFGPHLPGSLVLAALLVAVVVSRVAQPSRRDAVGALYPAGAAWMMKAEGAQRFAEWNQLLAVLVSFRRRIVLRGHRSRLCTSVAACLAHDGERWAIGEGAARQSGGAGRAPDVSPGVNDFWSRVRCRPARKSCRTGCGERVHLGADPTSGSARQRPQGGVQGADTASGPRSGLTWDRGTARTTRATRSLPGAEHRAPWPRSTTVASTSASAPSVTDVRASRWGERRRRPVRIP